MTVWWDRAKPEARAAAIRREGSALGRAESFSCNYTYREANRGSLYRQLGHFGFPFNGPSIYSATPAVVLHYLFTIVCRSARFSSCVELVAPGRRPGFIRPCTTRDLVDYLSQSRFIFLEMFVTENKRILSL